MLYIVCLYIILLGGIKMKKKALSIMIALGLASSTFLFPSATVFAADAPEVAPASIYEIAYQAHVQNVGWQSQVTVKGDTDYINNVPEAGTVGDGLRLEDLKLTGTNLPANASITYQGHVQDIGWQAPVTVKGNQTIEDVTGIGTTGQALRMEAVKITLNGMPGYSIRYEVQIEKFGWQSAVTSPNGTSIEVAVQAGTTGQALRLETIKIEIVKNYTEKKAEVIAIDDVAKAENSKSQSDVDIATEAVKSVQDTELNASLTSRIADAQKGITDATTAYPALKATAETNVTAYETSTTQLSTQALVDAAKGDKAVINLVGLNATDKSAFQTRIDVADTAVTAAQKVIDDATAAATYATLKATAETKVAAYEGLANADLSTQPLIDAANASKVTIVLDGLTDTDKSAFQTRIDTEDVKVTAAQKVIDATALATQYETATAAVTKAEGSNLQADIDSAKTLVNALPADVADATTKKGLLDRLGEVQVTATANATAPVITEGTATVVGDTVSVGFKINKDINLSQNSLANIIVRYGVKNADDTFTDALRSNGTPIIKNKTWDGYLNSYADNKDIKYGQGLANSTTYEASTPKDTLLSTTVNYNNLSMHYADAIWTATMAKDNTSVMVDVTDNFGNETVEYISLTK
jgi:uncharacterized protein YjdB